MEGVVEGALESTNYLVDRHWDKGYDKFRKYRNGRKVKDAEIRYRGEGSQRGSRDREESASSGAASDDRVGERTPAATAVRSSAAFSGGAPLTGAATSGAAFGTTSSSRRRQRNQLPSPDRDRDRDRDADPINRRDSIRSLQQESETSDRILRAYELETDDPKRNPESVLSSRDLRSLQEASRRDSAMASGYQDSYVGSRYDDRPRSQPPRGRYYEDDDSDYDERSGRRYEKRNGRGYDDRDYDRVIEETERYRGPVGAGPLVPVDRSYRGGSHYDGPYGAGAVAQYSRRSEGALDRPADSYVSRRSKSRGRDRDDRSYSRSVSRSRSRSREKGEGWRGKLDDTFDTTARGLGVGVAGAVIGGLAGREFGHKHRQRDIILGAVVGGLGANLAENKWRDWKEGKERNLERDEDRWEQKFDGRDYGRSRSNIR